MMGLISEISSLIGVSTSSCRRIANGAYRRYKVFSLPKKNGDRRTVAQPAREVKALQRAICIALGDKLSVHESATAYKKGSSILKNAEAHIGAAFLTKLDFSDFFHSVDAEAITHLLQRCCSGLSIVEVNFIIDACTWRPDGKKVLCIGAPSSPLFANAVMFEFDQMVTRALQLRGVSYTRYSDDITLSSTKPNVLLEAESIVKRLVNSHRQPTLRLNENKRIAVGRGTSMTVTGLTLTNQGNISVGRERKRGVRAGVNRFLLGQLDDAQTCKLKGEIAFVLSVEPAFRGVLLNTYGLRVWPLLPRAAEY